MPHSSAPWKLTLAGTQWGISSKGQDRNETDLANGSQLRDNWEADAKLILAAPVMLAALKSARDRLTFLLDGCPESPDDPDLIALREIKQAIKKAGG